MICGIYALIMSSEIGSKDIWLIMDISLISDGWSYKRNPGGFQG
jgi:hypothetical protein